MSRSDAPVAETANDRFKRGFAAWFWFGIIVATAAHFLLFLKAPSFAIEDVSFESGDLGVVDLPAEIDIPPAPAAISRPAAPVFTDDPSLTTDLTIPLTTLESHPAETLRPPDVRRDEAALAEAPTFTPMTVAPRLLNGDEIARALVHHYPPLLRDAGIGGTTNVWFFIDETGHVVRTLVHQTSGFEAFDQAALAVADEMVFSPALNRDERVPVWVSLAIRFEVQR